MLQGLMRRQTILLAACLIAALMISLGMMVLADGYLQYGPRLFIEDGWQYRWGDSPVDPSGNPLWAQVETDDGWHPMEFPGQPPGRNDNQTLWLKVKLPDNQFHHQALMMKLIRQSVILYQNGQHVYQYGNMPIGSNERYQPLMPMHFILLPPSEGNGALVFQISSVQDSIGIHSPVEFGEFQALLHHKMLDDFPKIISCIIMLFVGIVAALAYFRSYERIYLFFGGCAIMSGLLTFSTTFVKQIIWNAPTFWTNLIVISGIGWQIFWLYFLELLAIYDRQRYVRWMIMVTTIMLGIAYALFIYDAKYLAWEFGMAFFIAVASYFLMWWTLLPDIKHNLYKKIYIAGATVWFMLFLRDIMAVMGFVKFQTSQLAWGQIADIIALGSILVIKVMAMQRDIKQYSTALVEQNSALQDMQCQLQDWNAALEETVATRTRELENQQANWRQLFTNSPQAIAILDDQGRIEEINNTFRDLFRYAPEDVRGQYICGFLTVSDMTGEPIGEECLSLTDRLNYECGFRSSRGRVIPVSIIFYTYQTPDGNVGFYCTCSDISERKHSAAVLAESEKKFRLIAENTGDVIWTADLGGKLTYISPSVEKLLGITSGEAVSRSLASLLQPSSAAVTLETVKCVVAALEAGKTNLPLEVGLARSDGQDVWTESIVNLQRSEFGEVLGLLGVTRDISERRRAEDKMRQPYELYLRNEFFNQVLTGKLTIGLELFTTAIRHRIHLPAAYSVLFLQLQSDQDNETKKVSDLDQSADIANWLNRQDRVIAWESQEGIGVLLLQTDVAVEKSLEIEMAEDLRQRLAGEFPRVIIRVGIAEYHAGGMGQFVRRYEQARDAAVRGKEFWPDQRVFHYLDCGVLQFLSPYVAEKAAADFIRHTLGKLIAYDKENETNLLFTLEKIIYGDNLKAVAEQLFYHHKTIVNRKQRIEKILGQSLDSFEVRLQLAVALKLVRLMKTTTDHIPT